MKKTMDDVYSHRIDSNYASEVQYALATEDLIRNHCGKINSHSFSLSLKKNVALGCEEMEKICAQIVFDGRANFICSLPSTYYFLGKDWTGRLRVNYQLDCVEGSKLNLKESNESPNISFVNRVGSGDVWINAINYSQVSQIKNILDIVGFIITTGFESEQGIPVTFAFPGRERIEYYTQSFDHLPLISISQNYSEEVIKTVKQFLLYSEKTTHGILLISGPVGTGKSYLIRSILTELPERRAVVCTPPTEFLVQAGLLAQVVANFRKSVIVLEDVGEVITIDSASKYSDARANLLNFSEGFLSLLTDTIVVLSFNYEIDKIDPAVVRPGRCVGRILVKELSYEQASRLVSFDIPKRNYSLAEIYEMRRIGNSNWILSNMEGKIGFEMKK